MKTWILILVFFFNLSYSSNGQVIDKRIERFVKEQSVDTFLIYSLPCDGGVFFDSCDYEPPQYLFWQQGGKYFAKKFAYCRDSKAIDMPSSNVLTFYLSNEKAIKEEEIKPPTYFEIVKRKNAVDTSIVICTVGHSCIHEFTFHANSIAISRRANTFDLGFEKFDNGRENVYYSDNQRTKIKLLIDKISLFLNQLTDN